jgi:hypothetical protein
MAVSRDAAIAVEDAQPELKLPMAKRELFGLPFCCSGVAGFKAFVFGLEVLEALSHGFQDSSELCLGVARGDVLGAVPVEGFDVNEDSPLGWGLFPGNFELADQPLGFRGALVNPGAAQDLEPGLVRVVHKEEGDAVVMLQVSNADVLLVAAQVGEANGALVEDVEKAFLASAVLDVRPTGFGRRGHVEAIALLQELLFVGAKAVAQIVGLFDAFIEVAAAVQALLFLDEGSKSEFGETSAHGSPHKGYGRIRLDSVSSQVEFCVSMIRS